MKEYIYIYKLNLCSHILKKYIEAKFELRRTYTLALTKGRRKQGIMRNLVRVKR